MRMWKKETKRKRGGRDRALHVECLEDRKLLAATTETFTGPSLTSLIQEAYAGQETKLTNVASAIKRMEVVQQSNEILKARFSKILDYYIQAREQMGVMTKQAETDALAYHVRMELQMIR